MKKLPFALLVFVLLIAACSTGTPAVTFTPVDVPEVPVVPFTDQQRRRAASGQNSVIRSTQVTTCTRREHDHHS